MLGAEERADAQRALDLLLRQRTELRIGVGQAALAEQLVAVQAARRGIDVQASFVGLPNGIYYLVAEAKRGSQSSERSRTRLVILK